MPGAKIVPAAVFAGVAVTAHNVRQVLRLRRVADVHDHQLRHDTVVGAGEPQLRVAVLGDSSAAGFGLDDPELAYPYQLASRLGQLLGASVRVACVAERGARLRDVIDQQVPKVADIDPDLVVMSVGSNDAFRRRLPGQVAADTRELLEAVRAAAPDAQVFLGGPTDLRHAPGLPRPLNVVVGVACRAVAATQRSVADEFGIPFATLPEQLDGDFGPDGFHGGAAAHARAADITVSALQVAGRGSALSRL
ncbi:MAG: GDSL-type esterase/lipase family protein [Actinomycetota bacterium]|nr:GDSL-type esterase/lipase family protein [Actinomycetota bacterium]